MNLIDGMKVVYEGKKCVIIQTFYETDYHELRTALLTPFDSIILANVRDLEFDKEDLKRLRERAPILSEKITRFDMLDIN